MSTHNTDDRKTAILDALDAFVRQRPGLEFGNYGDVTSYRSELRSITRDLHDYRELRKAVQWRDGITADALLEATHAFSGRLQLKETAKEPACGYINSGNLGVVAFDVDYCTGQYFPTEYRKAACAVLAQALWDYTRGHAMPAPCDHRVRSYGSDEQAGKWLGIHAATEERAARGDGCYIEDRYKLPGSDRKGSAGDWLRAYFVREFGRGIARRWFN